MNHILVIEDEPSIADNICYALKAASLITTVAASGTDGLNQLNEGSYDLVILDVGLPDMDGFEVCRQIRLNSQMPILFLTARSDEIDRVVGLELGADDYICKPFSPRELVARVKTNLRRVSAVESHFANQEHHAQVQSPSNVTTNLAVDTPTRTVQYHGYELDLTPYEFGILVLLSQQPQRVFSRDEILTHVWREPTGSFDRAIDTHIKTLRSKLKAVYDAHDPIKTHRGVGYSWKSEA